MTRTTRGEQGHGVEARRLLRACRYGALATLSRRLDGCPFATVVPIMVDQDASAVILISRLAEHTRNINSDARTSLVVYEPGSDVSAVPRLTIAGMCHRIDDSAYAQCRYLRLFPTASDLIGLDFDFYRIKPVAIRYIAGFGAVHWLSPESFVTGPAALIRAEAEWLRRINDERLVDLRDCCRRFHAIEPAEVSAVAMDCDGLDVRADGVLMRITFVTPVMDTESLPKALEELRR